MFFKACYIDVKKLTVGIRLLYWRCQQQKKEYREESVQYFYLGCAQETITDGLPILLNARGDKAKVERMSESFVVFISYISGLS